jgi:hypothetical protein
VHLSGCHKNIELHPEVPPGLVLPTYYNMHAIYSRVARINRPVVPDINQIDEFVIPERYGLITVANVQQNFVLHRDTAMNAGTNNDSEAENLRLGTRTTPAIASNLFTIIIGIQNEHCHQSRTLFKFNPEHCHQSPNPRFNLIKLRQSKVTNNQTTPLRTNQYWTNRYWTKRAGPNTQDQSILDKSVLYIRINRYWTIAIGEWTNRDWTNRNRPEAYTF